MRAQLPAVGPTARREGPALAHPSFRLAEPTARREGDLHNYNYQQCSGVRCQKQTYTRWVRVAHELTLLTRVLESLLRSNQHSEFALADT